MKVWIKSWIIVFLLFAAGNAMLMASSMSSITLAGHSYVRLSDWARMRGLKIQKLPGGDGFRIGNGKTQFTLYTGSRESEVNDIRICLSFPLLAPGGVPYVSSLDVDTAFNPLIDSANATPPIQLRNIVLDPGHGGRDAGFQVGSQQEKKYTLLMAQELKRQLNEAGFKASLTRESDVYPILPERPEIALRRSADLFVSIHWNCLPGNKSMRGAQTFCLTPAGASSSNGGGIIGKASSIGNRNNRRNLQLAYQVQKSLVKHLGVEDRGIRRARFWVLRDANMPAILIEGGFMSNPAESRNIYDPVYRRKMASVIVEGIMTFKNHAN